MNYLIARAEKHFWEEPIISGDRGSGTIFFSGCSLRCVFCQNYKISREGVGLAVSEDKLISLMQRLEDEGAHNINLVTPSHYAKPLARTLEKAKKLISIPIVYNSGGYDRLEDLERLDGLVDIFLPDLKYYSSVLSKRYSGKEDYFERASLAIAKMRKIQPLDIIEDGIMKKGVIVRHLLLPTLSEDSKNVLSFLRSLDKNLYISLMAQYFPCGDLSLYPEINRRLLANEYNEVLEHFHSLGLKNGFTQDLDSAIEDYVPSFDLTLL